jgi:hypothetical protein
MCARPVDLRFVPPVASHPVYLERQVVPVEVKLNEFDSVKSPRRAEVDHITTPGGSTREDVRD